MRRRLMVVCAAMVAVSAWAQTTFRGVVVDEQGKPVEFATVSLLQGAGERMVGYTLTNVEGAFSLTTRYPTDSLQIAVSILGYATVKQAAQAGVNYRFALAQEAIQLNEVEVRAGRVFGKQDTINYDVSRFIAAQDESIKDVIKKMPGIDISSEGKISYNGKDISNFYVEDMDLSGGQYSRITNNLQAKSVETVQILENHQPIRALQQKVNTEDIALNLKLRPEFRDRWMLTLQGGVGASPLLWDATANAIQLRRNSQSAYSYKTNNTGNDVAAEQNIFIIGRLGQVSEPSQRSFLSQPSLTASLKKERLLFNDVHTLSVDRIYRMSETNRLRINAGYTHDERRQERGSETSYYQSDDTVNIAERSAVRLGSDKAELSVNLENNADETYLTNQFKATGNRENSFGDYSGDKPFTQHITTTDVGARNDFKTIRNSDDYTLQFHSLVRYNHLPSLLDYGAGLEKLTLNTFYTDNSLAYIRKRGNITHQYTAGVNGQLNNIRDGYSPYVIPSWQLNTVMWNVALSTPLIYTAFPSAGWNRFAVNPSLSVRYRMNYAWQFSASGRYAESYGDILGFYDKPFATDYRTTMNNNGIMAVNRQQAYSLYGEYKRTVREFFTTLTVSHIRTHHNRITEQNFEGDRMTLTAREQPNISTMWNIRGTISKGFYDYGLKLSLDYALNKSRGEQLNRGERVPYEAAYMQYEPKIAWTPSRWVELSYESQFRYGGSKIGDFTSLAPLLNIVQKLQLSYEWSDFTLRCSTDHYHNDVSSSQSVDAFLGDVSLRWRTGKWQLIAAVSNVFDKRQYSYTEYSSIQSYTSWINIRGREFLLSARYVF